MEIFAISNMAGNPTMTQSIKMSEFGAHPSTVSSQPELSEHSLHHNSLCGRQRDMVSAQRDLYDKNNRTPFNVQQKEYFSFINPGIDMQLDYSSQISLKSRDSLFVDRELLSKIYGPPPPGALKAELVNPEKRAFKNLIVLGCAFMFIFTAFVSLQSLQSTLNSEAGVGVASLCSVYAATVVSCLIAPAVIRRLTTKWTIVTAFSLFLVFISANFYPKGFVLIPSSILLGFLTGPLWSAQATYLTTLSMRYAHSTKQLQDITLNKFNGIFVGIYQMSHIWGHVITIVTLNFNKYTNVSTNFTEDTIQEVYTNVTLQCGARDCGVHQYKDTDVPHFVTYVPIGVRSLLLGIHLGCVLMGLVLAITLLDGNDFSSADDVSQTPSMSSQQLFFATLRILQDPRLQLLGPLVVFIGVEQAFVFSEFTKSYINCALGVPAIGSVMICFGAVTAVSSFVIGYISKHVKRFPIMTSGGLFNAGLLIALLWWRPKRDDPPMFYVIASCLGVCDAIWQTQSYTLFGTLFADTQEAAFASYRMFQAIGFALAFGYSYFLCVQTKVYIMASMLVVAFVFYSVIEFRLHRQRQHLHGVVVL